jgi:hypothetical protein
MRHAAHTASGVNDTYGAYYIIPMRDGGDCMNFIMHKGDEKDLGDNDKRWHFGALGNRIFTISGSQLLSPDPIEQAREVIRRFDLTGRVEGFTRCPACNGLIVPVDKDEVRDLIPPRTAAWLDRYYRCQGCGKVYWKGTHYPRLKKIIDEILGKEGKA